MSEFDFSQALSDKLILFTVIKLAFTLPVAALFTGLFRWATGRPSGRSGWISLFAISSLVLSFLPGALAIALLLCLLMPLLRWLRPKTPLQADAAATSAMSAKPASGAVSVVLDLLGVFAIASFICLTAFAVSDINAFVFIFGHMVLYLWPIIAVAVIGGIALSTRLAWRMITKSSLVSP